MIHVLDDLDGKVIGLKLSGKLHDEDYDRFVPMVEEAITAHGKVRMFVIFEDFHGWNAHALWDDMVFAATHHDTIERIAMVGDKTWEKWMAKVCQPFTKAEIKYFDRAEEAKAREWIRA